MVLKEYEHGLGAIRFFAMSAIVLCHILQQQENTLAFYFNIGVPIFLFISGYLFGKKDVTDYGSFLKKRFVRILLPYYMMLAVVIIANLATGTAMTAKDILSSILCQQWYDYTVPNCGHFWYISCILVCYLLTPVLQWCCQSLKQKSDFAYWLYFAMGAVLLQMIEISGGLVAGSHYYIVYAFGYFYSYAIRTGRKQINGYLVTAACILSVLGLIGIYLLGKFGIGVPGVVFEYYKVGTAVAICLFFIQKSRWFMGKSWRAIIKISDQYSYTVYLAHHIFILGSLSVLGLTKIFAINVILAVALTVLSALVLEKLSDKIIGWKGLKKS